MHTVHIDNRTHGHADDNTSLGTDKTLCGKLFFFSICIIRNVWKCLAEWVIAANSICFPFMGQKAYLHIELQLNDSMLVSFQC